MNELNNKKVNYISFHKRFANGEQYLYITPWGAIETEGKSYYWQERGVYNRIKPIIENIITNNHSISEAQLYGKNGIVARLVPIQRAYNAIKNRKHEYMSKLSLGLMIVEDGSVDLENLEEEGLAPGKVIVYRQGANLPKMVNYDTTVINIFQQEEDRLLDEFSNAIKLYF
jgi:hypothetical protein